ERTDACEEADRRGDQRGGEDDDRAEPERVPAAPPAAEDDDAAADAEEERRHPRRTQEPRVEEASPTPGRRRQALAHGMLVLAGDDGRHAPPFWVAHFWNAAGSITITRERMSACPRPQSSVQMTGYVPTLSGVMCSVGWIPGTRSCFWLNSGTQNEWITS